MNVKQIVLSLLGKRNLGMLEFYLRPSLRRGWGGPLNGQTHRLDIYNQLREKCKFTYIVETGTFRGQTAELFAKSGLPVYTCEVDPRYYTYARLVLRSYKNVQVTLDDSRSFLNKMAIRGRSKGEVVLFYLDAHWSEDLPLLDEVRLALSQWPKCVVMIDDFCVPNTSYGYDTYGAGKDLDLAYLQPVLDSDVLVFFPSSAAEQETGRKRGCVVLVKDCILGEAVSEITSLTRWAFSTPA
jgi:hypothetical protein